MQQKIVSHKLLNIVSSSNILNPVATHHMQGIFYENIIEGKTYSAYIISSL
jgi:TnpA family transposase